MIFWCRTFTSIAFRPSRLCRASVVTPQLAFELVEEAPIRGVANYLVRARFDQTSLVQAQRVKPDRVLRIVFAPFVIGKFVQRLHGIVVPRGKPAIDDAAC